MGFVGIEQAATVARRESSASTGAEDALTDALVEGPAPTTSTEAAPVDSAVGGGTVLEELAAAKKEKRWQDAFGLLAELSGDTLTTAWDDLGVRARTNIARALTHDAAKAELATVEALFVATDDGELKVLEPLFEARFQLEVGPAIDEATGIDFDAKGLRRCWTVLEALPAQDVQDNTWLDAWTRYEDDGPGSGYYASWNKESAIGYDPDLIDSLNKSADPEDPLYDVVEFNSTIRHEVGHAVDEAIGGSATYCIGNADGGNWTEHNEPDVALVREMASASKGALSSWDDTTAQGEVYTAIADALAARTTDQVRKTVKKLDLWKGDDAPSRSTKRDVLDDPIFDAIETNGPTKDPWYQASGGGMALGGRIYQESYDNYWTSYEASAWARKVSTYQFRAPGEWFAEAYATYYEPDADGNVGTKLAARDPKTKAWFDKHVHGR